MNASQLNIEGAVAERYSQASQQAEAALCCPVDYDAHWLEVLPNELIERDYGCGDPSKWVQPGDHVLDLGCGAGKICYIASQIVGTDGSVTGVDMNDDMLALARQYQTEITGKIGWDNVTFCKGKIQDLKLDMQQFEQWLQDHPAADANGWLEAEQQAEQLRNGQPMISNNSIDVVVSNCVLNLVNPNDRRQLFAELFRVLKPGGRAVISDIVSNQPVPVELQNDATLWSGCISGAFEDREFIQAFIDTGLGKVEIMAFQSEPWQVVEGIEFRSITLRAWKPLGTKNDTATGQSAIYRGPWKKVVDDFDNVLIRGKRMAVSTGQMNEYEQAPYQTDLILLDGNGQFRQTERNPEVSELPISDGCSPDGNCC
ncbi:MAG: methyltransferase [Planctomycetaceae bacterium]|nr:methyltransferase [Planctomycetaceae bacterium]